MPNVGAPLERMCRSRSDAGKPSNVIRYASHVRVNRASVNIGNFKELHCASHSLRSDDDLLDGFRAEGFDGIRIIAVN